jgi:radical SAM superfamily enzyme YgiQ (UPF0313 family)
MPSPAPIISVDLKNYFTIGHILRAKQLQIVTSRGCPFHCGYCYLLRPELRGYRTLSAKRVYAEIETCGPAWHQICLFLR